MTDESVHTQEPAAADEIDSAMAVKESNEKQDSSQDQLLVDDAKMEVDSSVEPNPTAINNSSYVTNDTRQVPQIILDIAHGSVKER